MLTIWNKFGLQEVLLCESENILSIEELHCGNIEDLILSFVACYKEVYERPEFHLFALNFVYGIEPKPVSMPIEIMRVVMDSITFEVSTKDIRNGNLGAIIVSGNAKKEKTLEYIDNVILEYKKSIIAYRNTGVNQNYFKVEKIKEIINDLKKL